MNKNIISGRLSQKPHSPYQTNGFQSTNPSRSRQQVHKKRLVDHLSQAECAHPAHDITRGHTLAKSSAVRRSSSGAKRPFHTNTSLPQSSTYACLLSSSLWLNRRPASAEIHDPSASPLHLGRGGQEHACMVARENKRRVLDLLR